MVVKEVVCVLLLKKMWVVVLGMLILRFLFGVVSFIGVKCFE